ncbi:MAG: response regulator [Eudoraea sp.]|nr:response regulator [Eudoraea sp.]
MGRVKRVCLIDDDHIFVYGAKRLMREVDFFDDLSVFNNGQDALDHFQAPNQNTETLPSVIFLDLNMPVMNGWEFLDAFLNIPGISSSEIAIYIMSSSVDPRDLEKIQSHPYIKNYILKPLTTEDLEKLSEEISRI